MNRIFLYALLFAPVLNAQDSAVRWWQEYSGSEANGDHVLGYWKFDSDGDAFLKDHSLHNHQSTLRGAAWNVKGKFGGCLESSAGYPIDDKSRSIHVKPSPLLSPSGAFTVEMWLSPKEEKDFPATITPMLLDSKYIPDNHTGFQLSLARASGDGGRQILVEMGMGDRTERWYSNRPLNLKPGEWRHIAFTYNAAGEVSFFVDGSKYASVTKAGSGPMAAAVRPLAIGDRLGSNYRGFPGYIDEVRISRGIREFRPIGISMERARPAFLRMTDSAKLRGELINQSGGALSGLNAVAKLPDGTEHKIPVPEMAATSRHSFEIPVNGTLKPGDYAAKVVIEIPKWGGAEGANYRAESVVPFVITSRPQPHRMPVVMWGIGGTENVIKEIPRLKDLGFTHCLGLAPNHQKIWEEGGKALAQSPEKISEGTDMLDTALANDVRVISTLYPGRWLRTAKVGKPFLRIDRKGNHYGREDVSGSFQQIQDFCFHTGAAMGRTWGDHPAYEGALLHTEVRGESQVSFHPEDIEAYRKATGLEIPPGVTIKNGVQYAKLKGFPKDRVIADDNPILKYLSWFWQKGDGWNDMNTNLHKGLKSEISREDFWTFHDPACRVPSISGSGGAADYLAHWTYSYPDPIRIGLCTDEMFEMARVNGLNQGVMKMTQVIWYRSQTAPINAGAVDASPWVDQDPDAAYITIAPMQMREAFWWKIARPIQGVMYHGWQSLVQTESTGAYRYTNPNAANELRRLTSDIVEPLGPMLMQIPDAPSDVAFLESFTSQMFARRGTYGWNHTWAGDLYHILMYAQLQPRVLYEESLLDDGLKGAKVLVMGDCDVLTESVVAKIKAFQKAGGLVIGDAEVCPAIKPDYGIPRFSRKKKAKEDRDALQAAAAKLRQWLDPKYQRYVDSENPDVLTRHRKFGTTDYIFTVNDHREFGTYVGNYGLVMENGLPSDTTIRVNRDSGHIYELPSGRRTTNTNPAQIPVSLGPCEGRIFMITQRPIEAVSVNAPQSVKRSETARIEISVTGGKAPIDAVIPLKVTITDPEGSEAEFTGHYGATGGKLTLPIDLAPNDTPGLWQVRAKELASGRIGDGYFRVE